MTGRYHGGPLDGQHAQRRGNRYSSYRHGDGTHMPTRTGDARAWRQTIGRTFEPFYRHDGRGGYVWCEG